jgi:hypothetical protein
LHGKIEKDTNEHKEISGKKNSHKITNEHEEISGHLCIRDKEMTKEIRVNSCIRGKEMAKK